MVRRNRGRVDPDREPRAFTEEDKRAYCYQEIKNLIWINRCTDPVYREALKEWERKATLFTSRVERKKKQSIDVKNEIYQLVGFFSVFQGVLLTAVSQSNLLLCNNVWSPVSLSALVSVVTIAGVVQKFLEVQALEKTICSEESVLKTVVKRVNELRREGKKFSFAKFGVENENRRIRKPSIAIYMFVVITALAASGSEGAAMVATTLINRTAHNVKLREGNAGVYILIQTILPEDSYKIDLDPNATFREYWVETDEAGRIIVTSDDCFDNQLIEIILDPTTNKYTTINHPRKPDKTSNQAAAGPTSSAAASGESKLKKMLTSLFVRGHY